VEEGGEGLQSRPTSPAPITQAEKNEVFFFFRASPLNAQRSPDFGHENRIIIKKDVVGLLLGAVVSTKKNILARDVAGLLVGDNEDLLINSQK
jgi:hypothetical protein